MSPHTNSSRPSAESWRAQSVSHSRNWEARARMPFTFQVATFMPRPLLAAPTHRAYVPHAGLFVERCAPKPSSGGHVRQSWLLSLSVLCASTMRAQSPSQQNKPSVHWEELTAADFKDAIARAQGTCLLPFGILEKHGAHLPLGNDLLNVRYAALNAAQQEYAIVFPEYYFGQIFEAKHQPGTVAYSA